MMQLHLIQQQLMLSATYFHNQVDQQHLDYHRSLQRQSILRLFVVIERITLCHQQILKRTD